MNPDRFDTITRMFSERKLSRRKAVTQTGAGIAAAGIAATGLAATGASAAAQGATPVTEGEPSGKPPAMLFVQSFKSGNIVPKDGAEGRYTATFENGLGQTVYFSDRPDRIVGAMPTDAFLGWIGFPDDNPPNAAILTDNGDGENTLAVVKLFDPVYDTATFTATYDFEILDHWQDATDLAFSQTPVDVPDLGASFGTTHLFIDGIADCPDATMQCIDRQSGAVVGEIANSEHDGYCYFAGNFACFPCQPWVNGNESYAYWGTQCEARFTACAGGACDLTNFCSRDAPLGHTYCKNSPAAH